MADQVKKLSKNKRQVLAYGTTYLIHTQALFSSKHFKHGQTVAMKYHLAMTCIFGLS